MADDNFRFNRSRAAMAPRSAGAPVRGQLDDPLAELARLIGQSEPGSDLGRDPRRDLGPDARAGDIDWAAREPYADDRYQEQVEPVEDSYGARYDEAPQAEAVSSYRAGAAPRYSRDIAYEPPPAGQFSAPADPEPRFNGSREFGRDGLPELSRFRDTPELPQTAGRQLPAFLPRLPAEDDAQDEDAPDYPDDQAYALEDYAEEAPAVKRRSGVVVVAAVLGLAVLGTAGAFAYRAMFGSSMLPSLPPIIKAEAGPNKIVPSKPKSTAADQVDAGTNSGEKLMSREEQPVDMPAPANPAPRVVATVPIFPDPNSAQAGVPNTAPGTASGGPAFPAPVAPAPQPSVVPTAPAASIWPPAPPVAPGATASPPTAAPSASPTAPRKVHTVIIHTDRPGAETAEALPAPAPTIAPPAPAPAPVRTAPPRAAAPPSARPEPRVEANGPLSILPNQGAEPVPARVRTALARPTERGATERAEPAPSAGGGYAVQVTSQRSEAEAQAEFRTLRAKFPNQLGGRQPIVRRADLGAKGVYYRALVGPFASAEQAEGMCSGLKAAGGSCIVQRN
jgi:SPOR domain